jgi:hypothetical protein
MIVAAQKEEDSRMGRIGSFRFDRKIKRPKNQEPESFGH